MGYIRCARSAFRICIRPNIDLPPEVGLTFDQGFNIERSTEYLSTLANNPSATKKGVQKMAQPIYKLFLFKPTEAWYQLSEQEKKDRMAQVKQALGKAGGKEIVECFSGWNSEQLLGWGVEVFPDIEAVQKHHALLVGLNWFRYVESNSYLGTEIPKS